jgi:transcriptional regulator with XRE-family HTH domain
METPLSPIIEAQLLMQLGDRLKRLRKAQRLGTVEMAARASLSRGTLRAVEAGSPSPSIAAYVRVMSILGISAELALLAGDTMQPATPGSAAARSRQRRPTVQVLVSASDAAHEVQDLQSLQLHRAAVALVKEDPALLLRAQETLNRWLRDGDSRSAGLWSEWSSILSHKSWRKVLGRTRRAQELRQASPLVTVLPGDVRQQILDQAAKLKRGVKLGA